MVPFHAIILYVLYLKLIKTVKHLPTVQHKVWEQGRSWKKKLTLLFVPSLVTICSLNKQEHLDPSNLNLSFFISQLCWIWWFIISYLFQTNNCSLGLKSTITNSKDKTERQILDYNRTLLESQHIFLPHDCTSIS